MKLKLGFRHVVLGAALGLAATFMAGEAGASDVLIVGDSMMKSVGRALKKECARRDWSVEIFTSIGSGLARLDLMDWHVRVRELVEEQSPNIAFVMMGANDNQAMQTGGGTISFGQPGWDLEYGRRAGKLMDILLDGGVTQVVWIGLPCMREGDLDADARDISRVLEQQAAARPHVRFIPIYSLFSKKGAYSAYIIKDSGMPLDVRAADGIHLNVNGAEFLAGIVMATLAKN